MVHSVTLQIRKQGAENPQGDTLKPLSTPWPGTQLGIFDLLPNHLGRRSFEPVDWWLQPTQWRQWEETTCKWLQIDEDKIRVFPQFSWHRYVSKWYMGSTVWSNSTGRAYLHNPAQICLSTIYANCQLVLVQIHRSLLLTRNCQKLEYDFLGWQNEMNHIQNRIKHPKLVTSKSNSQSLNLHQGGVPQCILPFCFANLFIYHLWQDIFQSLQSLTQSTLKFHRFFCSCTVRYFDFFQALGFGKSWCKRPLADDMA